MTYKEAITFVSGHYLVPVDSTDDEYAKIHNEAMDKAIEALEKQIPKKPTQVIDNGTGTRCPKCNKTTLTNWKPPYCMFCGQALDWSDAE